MKFIQYEVEYMNRRFAVLVEDIENFGRSSVLHDALDAGFRGQFGSISIYLSTGGGTAHYPHINDKVGLRVIGKSEVEADPQPSGEREVAKVIYGYDEDGDVMKFELSTDGWVRVVPDDNVTHGERTPWSYVGTGGATARVAASFSLVEEFEVTVGRDETDGMREVAALRARAAALKAEQS